MVATFCLRLAFGLIAPLVILDPRPIPPRFFRVQFLAAMCLLGVGGFFRSEVWAAVPWMLCAFSMLLCFIASIFWHIDVDNPARGRRIAVQAAILLGLLLLFDNRESRPILDYPVFVVDDFASAAVLGSATTAMLLGHSYLITPAMTIAPLMRLIVLLGVALGVRLLLACLGLWQWTGEHSLGNLDTETLLWLSARWLLGLLAPAVLGWMAWETARIRSTQSATGILYVVVVVCFLGELTSLLVLDKTGSIL